MPRGCSPPDRGYFDSVSTPFEPSVGRSFSGVLSNGYGSWFAVETIVESSTSSTTTRSVFGKCAMRIGKATISRSMPQAMSLLNRALTEQSLSPPIRWVICVALDKMAEAMHKGIFYE